MIKKIKKAFTKNKPELLFIYDRLQGKDGNLYILIDGKKEFLGCFCHIDYSGNHLIVNDSDNGFSENGRVKWIFDMNKYKISFKR